MIALWSKASIASDWVIEEADEGAKREILIPALLDAVEPPRGLRGVHACDLANWEGLAESPVLRDLVTAVEALLGRRKGVSIQPVRLAVVLGRPTKHPDLGAAVNLTCRFANTLGRDADLFGLTAFAAGPISDVSYHFDWRLPFDEALAGAQHIRRIERETRLTIPAGDGYETGIQLRAPIFTDVVRWPEGAYQFKLRGWIDRDRYDSAPNLKCHFEALLPDLHAHEITRHLKFSDRDWANSHYSDDAYGVPFILGKVRPGTPAA